MHRMHSDVQRGGERVHLAEVHDDEQYQVRIMRHQVSRGQVHEPRENKVRRDDAGGHCAGRVRGVQDSARL